MSDAYISFVSSHGLGRLVVGQAQCCHSDDANGLYRRHVAVTLVPAHAYAYLIGGFRKVFRPPIKLHPFPDPPYAEREITVHPYPPLAGEPTEVCVELRNPTPVP
ncbi:hypothetical protein ACFLYD_08900, partial [Chloroflexota bacterium]